MNSLGGKTFGEVLTSLNPEHLAKQKLKRTYCVGCWDLYHYGHLELLRKASNIGGYLIVGVVADEAIVRQKGSSRPIIGFNERYSLIEQCKYVDEVQAVPDFYIPDHIIQSCDFIVIGADQSHIKGVDKIPYEKKVTLSRYEGTSTSSIIKKIEDEFAATLAHLERNSHG